MSTAAVLAGNSPAFRFIASVTSATDYNVRAAAVAAGWPTMLPLQAEITVTGTGVVQASSTAAYAFTVDGAYPSGSTIALTLSAGGYIVGKGGNGGNGGNYGTPAQPGTAGGTALYVAPATGATTTITNNGVIGGGGGGGGGGYRASPGSAGGGGGGAGYGTGATVETTGGNGGVSLGATGGVASYNGGAGGNLGSVGSSGVGTTPGTGGAAGACTTGAANATWLVTGTRYGAIN